MSKRERERQTAVTMTETIKMLMADNRELVEALEAGAEHLTAMCVMARENNFTKWNSRATVETLKAIREVIARAKMGKWPGVDDPYREIGMDQAALTKSRRIP